jgi:Tetracyclin repressor-like, C-terminal domain
MYARIGAESREVVADHLRTLATRIGRVIADGVTSGDFDVADADTAGRPVLHATARFHHPAHVAEWREDRIEADLNEVVSLLLRGLQPSRSAASGSGSATRERGC